MRSNAGPVIAVATLALSACDPVAQAENESWVGQIDSLSSGEVVVLNLGAGLWPEGAGWRVVEDLRIGSVESAGPEAFGRISALAVDALERFWVVDGQAREIRLFDRDGRPVETIGRRGSGPGEFERPVAIDRAPDGRMWVMDPQNGRVSVFDTTGAYVEGLRSPISGMVTVPWPSGFDQEGHYYAPVVRLTPQFRIELGLFDASLNPIDTLSIPTDPRERDSYRIESRGLTRVVASVPFQGRMVWRRSAAGTVWGLITDEYRMFEIGSEGDTLRSLTKTFEPVPVTAQDRNVALEDLKWFVDQGGRVDPSVIPDHKPPTTSFFLDDRGNLWVARTTDSSESAIFDVFEGSGRFLGPIEVPFGLQVSPVPFVVGDALYGVTVDELGVQYVVRARIIRS